MFEVPIDPFSSLTVDQNDRPLFDTVLHYENLTTCL